MISGSVMFLTLIFIDVAIHVAIQLYFEGHPAFNDEEYEKITNNTTTNNGMHQYPLL